MMAKQPTIIPPMYPGPAPEPPKEPDGPVKIVDRVRLNTTLIVSTFVLLTVFAAGVYFTHQRAVSVTAEAYFNQATRAHQKSEFSKSIVYFQQYIQLVSEDSHAKESVPMLVHFGALSRDDKLSDDSQQRLYTILERYLRVSEGSSRIRMNLVDVGMKVGRLRDVIEHIGVLLRESQGKTGHDGTSSDHQVEFTPQLIAKLHETAGDCHFVLFAYQEAQKSYARSVTVYPQQTVSYRKLATLIASQPTSLCTRRAMSEASATEGSATVDDSIARLFPERPSGPDDAMQAAMGVLRLAIQNSDTTWLAWRDAAQFLAWPFNIGEQSTLATDVARSTAVNALRQLDELAGDNNGVLNGAELYSRTTRIPGCSDLNFDGSVTLDELARQLEFGERHERLQGAANAVEMARKASESLSGDAAGLLALTEAEVLVARAAQAYISSPATSQEYYQRAINVLSEEVIRALDWDECRYRLAVIHLRLAEQESDLATRDKVLSIAQDILTALRIEDEAETAEDTQAVSADPAVDASAAAQQGYSPEAEIGNARKLFRIASADTLWQLAVAISERLSINGQAPADVLRDELNVVLAAMEKAQLSPEFVELVRCKLLVIDRQWKAAANRLAALNIDNIGNSALVEQVLLLRSTCAERLLIPDSSISLAGQLVRVNSSSANGRLLLARGFRRLGRLDEAIDQLSRCAGLPGIKEELGRLLIERQLTLPWQQRSWTDIERIRDTLKQQPGEEVASILLDSDLQLARANSIQERDSNLSRSAATSPEAAQILAEGRSSLAAAIESHADDERLYRAQANFVSRSFDLSAAERLQSCQQILSQWPEPEKSSVNFKTTEIALFSLMPKEEKTEYLSQLGSEIDWESYQSEEQATLHQALGDAYRVAGDSVSCSRQYEAVMDLRPASLQSRTQLLDVLMSEAILHEGTLSGELQKLQTKALHSLAVLELGIKPGDEESKAAKQEIAGALSGTTSAEVKESAPNTAFYSGAIKFISLAGSVPREKLTASQKSELNQARELLGKASRLIPSWSAPRRIQGELEIYSGNLESGIVILEQAYQSGDYSISLISRLLAAYVENGQVTAGELQGRRTAPHRNKNVDAYNMVMKGFDRNPSEITGEFLALAQKVALALLRDSPETFRQQVNALLAKLSVISPNSVTSQLKAVTKSAQDILDPEIERLLVEAAYTLDPRSPDNWLALVNYYAVIGQVDKALGAVTDCETHLPPEPVRVRLRTLGTCYEVLARIDENKAAEHFRRALGYYRQIVEIDFLEGKLALADMYIRWSDWQAAISVIEEVLNSDANIEAGILAEIRRKRIQLIAFAGGPGALDAALAELRDLEATTVPERFGKLQTEISMLLAARREQDRPRIIELLESIPKVTGREFQHSELLVLAEFYLLTGRLEDGLKAYQKVDQESPGNPRVLAAAIMTLIRLGADSPERLQSAEEMLSQLQEVAPDSLSTLIVSVQLYEAQGKKEKAIEELNRYALRRRDEKVAAPLVMTDSAEWVSQNLESVLNQLLSNRELLSVEGNKKLLSRAKQVYDAGDQDLAARIVQQVVQSNELARMLQMETVRYVAQRLEGLGDLANAENLYRHCAKVGVTESAKLSLATFYVRTGRIQDGLTACDEQADQVPVDKLGIIALMLLRQTSPPDVQSAQKWIERATATLAGSDAPLAPGLRTLLGDLHVFTGNYTVAADQYRELLKLKPADLTGLNNLAWIHGRTKQNGAEGLSLIDRALVISPGHPDLLDTKAIIFIGMEKYELARMVLSEIQDESSPRLHFRLAEIELRSGNPTKARLELSKSQDAGLDTSTLDDFDKKVLEELLGQPGAS